MTTERELNLEYIFTAAVEATLQQIADEGARELRSHVWPNLTQTRRAVRGFVRGNTVHIGLYFGRHYNTQNSATAQRFEHWMDSGVLPHLKKRFPDILNNEISYAAQGR